jgi:hypothetical protein
VWCDAAFLSVAVVATTGRLSTRSGGGRLANVAMALVFVFPLTSWPGDHKCLEIDVAPGRTAARWIWQINTPRSVLKQMPLMSPIARTTVSLFTYLFSPTLDLKHHGGFFPFFLLLFLFGSRVLGVWFLCCFRECFSTVCLQSILGAICNIRSRAPFPGLRVKVSDWTSTSPRAKPPRFW